MSKIMILPLWLNNCARLWCLVCTLALHKNKIFKVQCLPFLVLNAYIITYCIIIVIEAYKKDSG